MFLIQIFVQLKKNISSLFIEKLLNGEYEGGGSLDLRGVSFGEVEPEAED
jgi:hypothetical protein